MFRHEDNRSRLNKALRIGYIKMKKKYGEDEVQEQAAEIWKLTSEEQSRLYEENTPQCLSPEFVQQLGELFDGWKDKFAKEEWEWIERNIFEKAMELEYKHKEEGDADRFLSDITPVRLRIRKLTERECLRLMDVDDEDIDKMIATGLSKSALYKLAGNSIVVNVLYYIFRNMFIEETEQERGQLSLF